MFANIALDTNSDAAV